MLADEPGHFQLATLSQLLIAPQPLLPVYTTATYPTTVLLATAIAAADIGLTTNLAITATHITAIFVMRAVVPG